MQELLLKEQEENSLLRDITGVQRLEDVAFLDAVVDCEETSLSNLGEKMPLLRELKLNNSALHSIRNLGSKLKYLQILWVSHCGLTGLEGLNALPCLKELYAAFNRIDNLEPIADMETLEILDLEGNGVDDLGGLVYLKWCPQLAVVTLADNPIATDANYQAEVLEALPQLQTLDDVRLNRPLSPLSKIAAAHRHVANGHTASATPYIHAGPSSQAQPADTALASRWYPQHLSLTISNGSHSGRSLQRPRSAGGIPQRLPPVASGRNQPGSFLLHSITQSLPPDPLLVALGEAPGPSTEKTGPQTMLSTREDLISQLCSDARKQESSLESVDALSSYSTGEAERAGRTARPASAGFRRPGAAQAIIAPDTSRPSSADSDAGSSPEGAGLFWRKHRLTAPQGLSLTLLDHSAITAGTSSTADQPDVDEEILLDTDNQSAATASPETGEGHAEASARGSRHEQQHSLHDPSREGSAMQSETQVGCSKQLQHRSNLPADREKLQQRMELPASCDAVQAQQPEVPMCANQLSGAAHTQQKLQPSDCQEQSESGHVAAITALQANTGAAIDLLHHLSPGQQPVSSMVQQQCDTEPVEHQLAAHAATQRQTDSATISGSNPAEETCSGGSSFLQRLAREKQMPPKSMQPFTNESATDRPPTPERPITPFSRPARRRNSGVMSQEGAMLTSVEPPRASTDNRSAHGSRAAGFADNNRIFAPMQDMDSTYMASISAKLAVRPASASAAQLPMAAGSPLSWTGSMQLPPGMLFGAAQQQHLLLKSKKRFNWGFDSPHRL